MTIIIQSFYYTKPFTHSKTNVEDILTGLGSEVIRMVENRSGTGVDIHHTYSMILLYMQSHQTNLLIASKECVFEGEIRNSFRDICHRSQIYTLAFTDIHSLISIYIQWRHMEFFKVNHHSFPLIYIEDRMYLTPCVEE